MRVYIVRTPEPDSEALLAFESAEDAANYAQARGAYVEEVPLTVATGAPDTITLPRPVALLLADLLDRAAEEFSRHGCNDYDLPAEAEPARESILRAYATWNRSPDVPAYPGDDALMALGSAILRDPSILGAGQ